MSGGAGHLRAAGPGDVPFIASIFEAPENWGKLDAYSPARLEAAMAASANLIWIWETAAGPGGFAWVRLDAQPDGAPKLEEFGVRVPGQGGGSAFMAAILEALTARYPGRVFWLNVAADNAAAIRFYARFGFVQTALTPGAWQRRRGPAADVCRMERRL